MNALRLSPYQQHVHRWEGCVKCPLHKGRDRMCFARGQVPCDVLFVGEAPGESENVLGLPFVGPAGKELDKWIANAGGNRHRIAFTNLVACYPAEAKMTDDHRPPPLAIEACGSRLVEMIALAKPKLLIRVGDTAQQWLPSRDPFHSFKFLWPRHIDIIHPAALFPGRMSGSQAALAARRAIDILSQAMEAL